jgi:hypothetical protein
VLDFVIKLINFVTYRIFKLNNEKYLIFASRWKYRKKLSEKVVQNPILMFILLESVYFPISFSIFVFDKFSRIQHFI